MGNLFMQSECQCCGCVFVHLCACVCVGKYGCILSLCACVCPLCLCVSTADRALSLPAIRFQVFGLSEADSPVTTAASPFPESLEGFLYRLTLPENPHLISALQTDVTCPVVYLLCLAFISLHFSIVLDHRPKKVNVLFSISKRHPTPLSQGFS